ncbi:hypothetical protein I4U23_005874 [Adineta vaga]|nr:hypothetical protein I4U23_005874 [Adineta vaga]
MASSEIFDDINISMAVDEILWIDANSFIDDENQKGQQELQTVFEDVQILIFKDPIDCQEYIREHIKNLFLIIVSRQWALELIKNIHDFDNIKSIYIYCRSENWNEEWMKNYIKISGIFNEMHQLVTKIQIDHQRRERVQELISIRSISVNMHGDSALDANGDVLVFRLLIDFLRKMDWTENDGNEFFSYWSKRNSDIINNRCILNEFMNTYSLDKVFWWYTRQTFFYNALNKALRQQNIEVLLQMRFFINDIYDELRELQQSQHQTSIRTYRGQLISSEELSNLEKSLDQSILMKSFLSTTIDRNLAMFVLGDAAEQIERWRAHQVRSLKRVLFIIDADSSKLHEAMPFADISSKSYFPEEQEVLFMAGSVFHVHNIHFDENEKIYFITMECCDLDVEFKQILNHQMTHLGIDNSLITLGHIMQKMGRLDLAETYYHLSLNKMLNRENFPYDQENIGVCYNSLGTIAQEKEKYDESLEWYKKSLEKYKQILPADHDLIADSYRYIGSIQAQLGNVNQALESLEIALKILKTKYGEMHRLVATSLELLHKALYIKRHVSPEDYPSLSSTMNNIANVHQVLGQFDEAIMMYECSLEAKLKSMAKSHPSVIKTYYALYDIYKEKGNDDKVSEYAQLIAQCDAYSLTMTVPNSSNIKILRFKEEN